MQRGDAQSFDSGNYNIMCVMCMLVEHKEYTCHTIIIDSSDAKSEGQQIDTIMRKIDEFEGRFKSLKEAALTEMTNAKVGVKELVMTVTSLPATVMDEHRVFLRENVRELCSANDITTVFVWLNTYWDYLNYTLLQYIVNQYGDPKTQQRMKVYVDDLKQFRRNTSLHLFCKAQPRRHREVPPGFRELVTKHEKSWFDCTLEDVEQFRQDFAWEYDLRQVALMLREMELGSIVITWWIPDSAVSHLRERIQSSSGSEFLTEQGIEEVFIKESPESEGDDRQSTRQITSLYSRTLTEPVKPTKTLQSLVSTITISGTIA